jgi:hypothetical protein
MIINRRRVTVVTYRTDRNWLQELPQAQWLCVLLADGAPRRYLDEVLPKLLLRNVAWVCCVGQQGEWVHDLLDEEIVFREVEELYLPPHLVMTTWHEQLEEGLAFALFTAHYDEAPIEQVVVLDLTAGAEQLQLQVYLQTLASSYSVINRCPTVDAASGPKTEHTNAKSDMNAVATKSGY